MPYNPSYLASAPKNVQNIIGALTLPEVFKQCPRYNGAGSGKATVAKTLKQEFSLTWGNSAATQLPANEMQIFTFRNLLRALIYYYRQCPTYDYAWQNPANNLTWTILTFGKTILNSSCWAAPFLGAQPHGTKLFPGRGKGHTGIWVDNDGTNPATFRLLFEVGAVPTPPGANTQVTSRYWTGKDWAINKTSVMAAGDTRVDHTAPIGGAYMFFEVDAPAAGIAAGVVGEIHVFTTAASDVWAHRAVSNIDELLPIIQGARVNGSVAWLRNESPEQYEQGKILGSDVAKTVPWQNIAGGSAQIMNIDEYYSGDAKVGAYGFITPDDEEDFQMTDDVVTYTKTGSVFNPTSFPLKDRSPYVSMVVSTGDQNSQSRTFTFVSWHMIEYYSNSPIQQKEDSDYTPEEWQAAIEFMKHMEQIYENKFHISQIFDAIARYGGPISQAAAEILKVFPQTAPLAQAIEGERFQENLKRLGSHYSMGGSASKKLRR